MTAIEKRLIKLNSTPSPTDTKRQKLESIMQERTNGRPVNPETERTGERVESGPKLGPELIIGLEDANPDPLLPIVGTIRGVEDRAGDPRNEEDGIEVGVDVGLGLLPYQSEPKLHRLDHLLDQHRHGERGRK